MEAARRSHRRLSAAITGLLYLAHALPTRQDLPIPAWLFAWGASIVLIVSFFALAVGWRAPRFERDDWRALAAGLSRAALGLPAQIACGLVGVFLLGVAIYAGLEGTEAPDRNFAVIFIFVTVWLGFPLFSIFLGDVFRPFNPWRAIGRAAGAGFTAISGQAPARLAYPERLGRWPAAIGLLAFVWLELVYGPSSGIAVGLSPHSVGTAALVYTIYTLTMMGLFGTERWCDRGEVFSVYFGMFASLGSFAVRDGRLGRRKPFSAATRWAAVPGSLALVVASIATTTFDGAGEGVFLGGMEWLFDLFRDLDMGPVAAARLTDTLFMLATCAGVFAIYMIGVRGMAGIPRAPSLRKLRSGFAHTLIPIAFAYLAAHYFSLFVFQEQAQFTFLLSDPLGTGTTDLFGTARSPVELGLFQIGLDDGGIDYKAVSANAVWYVQVGVLVAGHVLALTLAHDRATAYWSDYRLAARSQYWMLAVMVAFTCFGLYLLSVANE